MDLTTLDNADDESPPDFADPRGWQGAQSQLATELAHAAFALGALDAAVEGAPWIVPRLALIEAEMMLWAQGIVIRREEIGRDLMSARAGSDMGGLVQARWAVRRLAPGDALLPADATLRATPDLRDLRGFLGLHRVDLAGLGDDLAQRPCGEEFDEAAQGFWNALAGLSDLHPVARAAATMPLWRLAGLSPVEDVIEGASFTALLAARDLTQLPFLPLGRHGRGVWRASGTIPQRLGAWLGAVRRGADDARAELRRLQAWAGRSGEIAAQMKGETPARLVEAALKRPLISTEDAETMLAISRDTAERGLARLQKAGVLREVTGRGRFRLWVAAA